MGGSVGAPSRAFFRAARWPTAECRNIRRDARRYRTFAEVATDQNMALQLDALREAGVDRVFRDQGVSGSTSGRPGLDACLDYLREGDILTVWKLDRLGRNTQHVLTVVDNLMSRGVGFRSITEGLHTEGAMGKDSRFASVGSFLFYWLNWVLSVVATVDSGASRVLRRPASEVVTVVMVVPRLRRIPIAQARWARAGDRRRGV
jgi:hypothetical protein